MTVKVINVDALCLESSPRHRRKASSPQKCIIPVRTGFVSGSESKGSKSPTSVPFNLRFKLPKRRQLFASDTAEHKTPISAEPVTVVPDTEQEEDYQVHSKSLDDPKFSNTCLRSAAFVPDSEPMMIADTQEMELVQSSGIENSVHAAKTESVDEQPIEPVNQADTVIESSQENETNTSTPQPNSSNEDAVRQTKLSPFSTSSPMVCSDARLESTSAKLVSLVLDVNSCAVLCVIIQIVMQPGFLMLPYLFSAYL